MRGAKANADRPRRTQAQRRAVTRAKITTAALDALARGGFAPMTIADVASSAGVSRGALLHYFPQKSDLALAAIEEAEAIVLRRLRASVEAAADSAERDERILDALYDIFSGIEFQAFLALQVHARTDPALNARLHKTVEHATVQMGAIAAEGWGPDVERSPELPTTMRVIVGTVRGLVLVAGVSAPYNADVWPAARKTLLRLIEELRASAAH